jgi:aromatic ring-opening dioxygenase catalytic subunit (LigB family)
MTSTPERGAVPVTRTEWLKALDELPSTPNNIPAFFFAHGSPMLVGPNAGALGDFLRDFGPALLQKYQPKGIVVFISHRETTGDRLGEIRRD